MTVDINCDVWSAVYKLESSSTLKYSNESSRGNSFKDKMIFRSILRPSLFIK